MHLTYFKEALLTYVDVLREDDVTHVLPSDVSSRRLLRELLTKRLKITVGLSVNPVYIDADNSTSGVYSSLKSALVASNALILNDMQTQSSYFMNVSVSGITVSSYVVGVSHSALPTSTPTSQPSCGIGSSQDGGGCTQCAIGYYTDTLNADLCTICPIDTYNTAIGSDHCEACPAFTANVKEGSNDCPCIYLHTSSIAYYTFIAIVFIIVVSSLIFAGENVYIMFMLTLFPILDIITDLIYILSMKFWNFELFISAICFFILPSLMHLYQLIKLGARPTLKEFIMTELLECDLIWLTMSRNGFPLVNGQRSSLSFDSHEGADKLFAYWLLWIALIVLQLGFLVMAAMWYVAAFLFVVVWVSIGLLLFQTKMLAIGKVWNTYFYYLTQSSDFDKEIELDATVLNESLFFEFLLETIPQITIQLINNTLTFDGKFSTLSILSLVVSIFIAFNGVYRYGYYLLWKKLNFNEIPLPLTIRLKEIKRTIRSRSIITRNVSALMQAVAHKKVVPERHETVVRSIVKNKKMSIVPSVKKSLTSFLVIADQLNQLDQLGVSYDDLQAGGEIDESNRAEILKFLQSTNDKWNKLIVKTAGRDSIKVNAVAPLTSMQHSRLLDMSRHRRENDDSSDSDNSDSDASGSENSDSENSGVDNSNEVVQRHDVPEQVDELPSAPMTTVLDVSSSAGEVDGNHKGGNSTENSIVDEIRSLVIDIDKPLITDDAHQSNGSTPTPQAAVVDDLTREYDSNNDDSSALDIVKELNTESDDDVATSTISVVNTTTRPVQVAVDTTTYSSSSKAVTRIARPTNEFISIITYPQETAAKKVPSFDDFSSDEEDDEYPPKQAVSVAKARQVSNAVHHRGSLQPPALDPSTSASSENRRQSHAAGSTLFQWR